MKYRALGKNSMGIFAGLEYFQDDIEDDYWTQEPIETSLTKIKNSLVNHIDSNMIESIKITDFNPSDGCINIEIICLFDSPRLPYHHDIFLKGLISSVDSYDIAIGKKDKNIDYFGSDIEIYWKNLDAN